MGLGGLAAVVLLVSLTNIIIENVRQDEAEAAQQAAASGTEATEVANAAQASEPLADLGVTPVQDGALDSGAVPAVVPDLDPDPALKKPMDRDPGVTGAGTGQ